MHVAVAIVGYRNAHEIVRCLEALARQDHADFEVVVCENGGREAYDALVAAVPQALPGGQPVRVAMAPSNLGFGGGVNVCLSMAPDADAWWVLNPDTEAEPASLRKKVARLALGNADAVGCTLYLPDGRVQSHGGAWSPWLARATSIGHGGSIEDRVDPAEIERRQNYLNGAAMLISRGFLQKVGPMREEYFLYCEEVEWCLRAIARGARLGYAPGALILHYQGTTTGNERDIRRRPRMPIELDERNKMLVTRDCFPARLPVAALASFALILLRFGKRRAWRQLGYAIGGWRLGLVNRRGVPAFVVEGDKHAR